MYDNGYIKLYRGLAENSLWLSEPFTKGQAWADLLMLTNYKPSYLKYRNGEMVRICRGECGYSMETLAKRWKWSRGKVKRYFDLLESEKMIQQKIGSKSTIIKVLKFEMYQERTSNEHQTDIKRTLIKKEKKERDINISLSTRERVGKREREILKSYCKKNGVKNENAYIKALIKNGDAQEIIEEEKRKNELKQRKEKEKIVSFVPDLTGEQANEIFKNVKQKISRREYG